MASKRLLQTLKPHVPAPLLPAAVFAYRRIFLRALAVVHDARDHRRPETGIPLPPAKLRARVHTLPDAQSFLEVGRRCVSDLEGGLARAGTPSLESFTSVLDFGCGCGRTLRWLDRLARQAQLAGTDIDGECVSWCAENIPFAQFSRNELLPPLGYTDGAFDLVYALSVFTHMTESAQDAWLAELHRITRPVAVLLLSTHGPHTWSSLSPRYRRRVEQDGFLWIDTTENAYHSPAYVRERWSPHFDIVDIISRGVVGYQDLVVARPT
jgi:SAM-dependent methyltransferase